ncbi:hypothetical protein MXB_4789 [Myxobolus squamalis]|nr:hypothetical protein MXB_4789 [Myxobolus squamalis]
MAYTLKKIVNDDANFSPDSISSLTIQEHVATSVAKESKIFDFKMFFDVTANFKIQLMQYFPQRTFVQEISLVYSTNVHGTSIKTMYSRVNSMAESHCFPPIFLLAIKDFYNTVFGALLNEPPCPSNKYYGNGEMFVYSFKDGKLNTHHWSGFNEYFVTGTSRSFSIGSDQPCSTFNSPILSTHEDFECRVLEIWAFSMH